MLTLLFNVYSEGIIINIGILSILAASLIMEIAQKKIGSWFARKLKGIIRNISYCLVPLILHFTIITVMTIAFKPPTYFQTSGSLLTTTEQDLQLLTSSESVRSSSNIQSLSSSQLTKLMRLLISGEPKINSK